MADNTRAERLNARQAMLVAHTNSLLETELFYKTFMMDVDTEHMKISDMMFQFTKFLSEGFKTVELRFEAERSAYEAAKMNFDTELNMFLKEQLAHAADMSTDESTVSLELQLSYRAYADSFHSYQNSFKRYESAYLSLKGYFEGMKTSVEKLEQTYSSCL